MKQYWHNAVRRGHQIFRSISYAYGIIYNVFNKFVYIRSNHRCVAMRFFMLGGVLILFYLKI